MRSYAFVTQQPCLQAHVNIDRLSTIQILLIIDRFASVPRVALVWCSTCDIGMLVLAVCTLTQARLTQN
jgi:hypothetical protein